MTIDARAVEGWLQSSETDLLEFKREWYDLSAKQGKADLVKDVLSLANTTRPGEHGYLVIGIEDDGPERLVGVSEGPSTEQLLQILSSWTQPAPAVTRHRVALRETVVDVVEVPYEPFRPHYATRDLSPTLSSTSGVAPNRWTPHE